MFFDYECNLYSLYHWPPVTEDRFSTSIFRWSPAFINLHKQCRYYVASFIVGSNTSSNIELKIEAKSITSTPFSLKFFHFAIKKAHFSQSSFFIFVVSVNNRWAYQNWIGFIFFQVEVVVILGWLIWRALLFVWSEQLESLVPIKAFPTQNGSRILFSVSD